MGIRLLPDNSGDILFTPKKDFPVIKDGGQDKSRLEGWGTDGRYIQIPANSTTNLIYYTALGGVNWTISQTAHSANPDTWAGFYFDATDDVIYTVAIDTTPALDVYYLASINEAGSAHTNIGNGALTTSFSVAPNYLTMAVQRTADGSGNLRVINNYEYIEINPSTGAIATQLTEFDSNDMSLGAFYYSTVNGYHMTLITKETRQDNLAVGIMGPDGVYVHNIMIPTSWNLGHVNAGTIKPRMWKGYVSLYDHSVGAMLGPRHYERAAFDSAIERLARRAGVH